MNFIIQNLPYLFIASLLFMDTSKDSRKQLIAMSVLIYFILMSCYWLTRILD